MLVYRCFYLNLPVGGVAGLLLILFLRTPTPSVPKLAVGKLLASFDPLGCCLFLPSIICLIQALEWGGYTYAWSDWRIIVLLVFFAVSAEPLTFAAAGDTDFDHW